MKTRLLALLATLMLLITCAAFAVSASGSVELPGWDDFAPDSGFDSADTPCPHCVAANAADTTPEWTQYTGTGETFSSGTRHIYIDNDEKVLNLTAQIKLSGGTTVVWIKPGVSVIGASNANVFRAQGGDLWVLGGSGSVVTGPGNASGHYNGGLMRVMNANSDVHIYGDVTIQLNRENNEVTGSSAMGGLVDVYSGNLYMRDGTMIGPVDASSGVVRGAVAITNTTGNFYMSGGRMKGSGVNEASPISFYKAGKVEISGDAYIEGYSGAASAGGGYAIYQTVAGTVNIKGGTIKGGTVTGEHTIDGSAIYLNAGNVNISDGTVYGGTATNGGAIYVAGGATTITGGTVYGGTATNGGAIYVAGGALTMQSDANNANGGTVNGSVAEKGGAIYLDENATFTLTKGTVNGCSITNDTTTVVKGGAIYTKATGANALTLTGGTINGGTIARAANTEQSITALNGLGGAVYMEAGTVSLGGTAITGGTAYQGGCIYTAAGTLSINGSNISGGTALSHGGAIYAKGTVNMLSGAVYSSSGNRGGNIFAESTMTVSGGNIYSGNGIRGGNLYLCSTFTMSGGTVEDGTATQYAGNIFLAGSAACSITGGTIEDGTSQGGSGYYGGNLHVYACDLSISDTAAPIIIRNGTANSQGGNISVMADAEVTINMTRETSGITGGSAVDGAGVYSKGTVTLTAGTITGGTATNGGAIYVAGGNATITGGTVYGGTATNGGAIYVAGGTLTMQSDANNANGGTVNGSIAEKGGAIYLDANAAFTMTNGTVNGTTITKDTTKAVNGGAIYSVATGATAVQLNGGTINGGTVALSSNSNKGNGGAIYINGGVLNLGGVDIVGGTANQGGCMYVNAGTVNMTAGTISGANGLSNGGTVFLKDTMNMSGGKITVNPNNTYAYSKGIRVNNGTLNLSGDATVISAGKAEGDGVYAVSTNASQKAKVTLAGKATVCNPSGTNASNIFLSNWGSDNSDTRYASKIEIIAGWEGSASVKFGYIYSSGYALPDAAYSVGMSIPAAYAVAAGDYSGSLRMEMADGQPNLWWDGATGVKASDVQTVKKVDGNTVSFWEKNNNAAVAAYDGGYIKLLNANPIDLQGKEVYVDFNGNDVAVTLSGGKLYGLDSTATVTDAGQSQITVTDGTPETYTQNPVTGQHIIALTENGSTSFHTVDIGIDSVSLRPSAAGIYYGASFLCDDVLKPYVDCFGVAVSLLDMPGTNFEDPGESLYTWTDGKDLGLDSYNSVLIKEIMKDQAAATNKSNAQMPIYASAYMKLSMNGQTYTMMGQDTAQMSLKDVLQRIDKQWHGLNETARNSVISQLYDAYIAKFEENDWNLANLEAEKLGLDKNRELKVLTIGNSLAVDASRMLAYVAQQEGSVGIKVGTLYKANCSVQEHADFLVNDKPNYWYYESGFDAENPGALTSGSLVPSETKQYVGYNAIVAEDWDVIIMQHSVFGSAKPDTYDESIDTIINYVNTHKTNPNAIFVWNMTWMGPVDDELLATAETSSPGFDKSYINYTKDPLDREAQTMMYEQISSAVYEKILPDNRFVYILPSATMMQNALTATSDKVMYRDYIHGSDYGRLMNAYLWYSMITNKTITDPAVDVIPGALRQATANQTTDLTLTQRMQDVMVESVNNAKADPFNTTQSAYQKKASLKVLAIGNSFSQDTMWHLEEIARSEGYTDVKLGTLYIGGSSLNTNWAKADGDIADYQYYYNYDANWKNSGGANYSISQALAEQDWDIVTLQQSSGSSGQQSTYEPYLENLINYVQTNEPNAKILWNMTWSYAQDSTHADFPKYDSNQMTMYNAIIDATQNVVVPYVTSGDLVAIIPCGTAIQNARTSYVGDEFDRDGYHLNIMGRIVTACTWYSVLTGDELDELSVSYFDDHFIGSKPSVTLNDADKAMILEAVSNAIADPYQVTAFAD